MDSIICDQQTLAIGRKSNIGHVIVPLPHETLVLGEARGQLKIAWRLATVEHVELDRGNVRWRIAKQTGNESRRCLGMMTEPAYE